MAVVEKKVIRYVVPEVEFKAFLASQLNVSPNDIDRIGLTEGEDAWEVVLNEVDV